MKGQYLFGPWGNGIHLSFGTRISESASVRFNLRYEDPETLAQHEAEVHKLLDAAGISYRPGRYKTGQKRYASFNVVPEQTYDLPEQEEALFGWMIRCWHMFEDYRQRLT